jgi:hypothetical protein
MDYLQMDYLQLALAQFNIGKPQWYGWKKHNDDGTKIPNNQRMCYECLILNDNTAIMPTKAQVEAKIQELKDAEVAKEQNKQSAISKLKALGLNDAEIKAITGI